MKESIKRKVMGWLLISPMVGLVIFALCYTIKSLLMQLMQYGISDVLAWALSPIVLIVFIGIATGITWMLKTGVEYLTG